MEEREEIFTPKSSQELEKERVQKITEYERYIDVELKGALKNILDQRDKIYDQISQ